MKKIDFDLYDRNNLFYEIIKRKKNSILITKEFSNDLINLINEYAKTLDIKNIFKSSPEAYNLRILIILCNTYENIDEIKRNHQYIISNKKKLSVLERLAILYGPEKSIEYSNNLKQKSREKDRKNIFSVFQYEFWIRKGYSKEDAIIKAKSIAKETGLKSVDSKIKNGTYKKMKYNNPISKHFWISRGYTDEEADVLRAPYLNKCVGSLERSIQKYGFENGVLKHEERQLKRKLTNLKKYGCFSMNGYTSKESLKFFIPLYKKLRKLGIQKNDIFWGIKGSKEFRIRLNQKENSCFFYDFTIKSKKLIIEYNNLHWHPRSDIKWSGHLDEETLRLKDKKKLNLALENGFEVITIWNDDNLNERIDEIVKRIYA